MSIIKTLTLADDNLVINLDETETNYREFIIHQESVFDGAILKIGRLLLENAGVTSLGYTDILDPFDKTISLSFTNAGAGNVLSSLVRKGKIKFYLSGATASTNIILEVL